MRYRINPFFRAASLGTALILLAACGSSGGQLSLGEDEDPCGSTRSATLNSGSVSSGDGQAKVIISQSITQAIQVAITVDCDSSPQQIGNAYVLRLNSSGSNILLEISYAELDLGEISPLSLRLGVYNPDSESWLEGGTLSDGPKQTVSFEAPQDGQRYAIFSGGSIGGSNPPDTPVIDFVVVAGGVITVSWFPVSDPDGDTITSYLISRTPQPGSQIDTVVGTQTRYVDTGEGNQELIPGQTYCYAVTAVDETGERSNPSDEACRQFFDG